MRIMINHSVDFAAMRYAEAIDHDRHTVIYFGIEERLDEIPHHLSCEKIQFQATEDLYSAVYQEISSMQAPPERLISVQEQDLMVAASLREAFNIPGPRIDDVMPVRDKIEMKHRVARAGVPVPAFFKLSQFLANDDNATHGDYGVILKPRDGCLSIDTQYFADGKILHDKIRRGSTGIARLDTITPAIDDFEVEEFVSGAILHFDGFVARGKMIAIMANRYINTPLDFMNGKPVGSIQIPMPKDAEEFVARSLAAVGINHGVFHLEAILGSEGLVFMEVAHRAGGAGVVEMFELRTGVHLSLASVASVVDPDWLPELDYTSDFYGRFRLPGHHLKSDFAHIYNHEFLLDHPGVLQLNMQPSDKPLPRTYTVKLSELPLSGIVCASGHEENAELITKIFEEVRLAPKL